MIDMLIKDRVAVADRSVNYARNKAPHHGCSHPLIIIYSAFCILCLYLMFERLASISSLGFLKARTRMNAYIVYIDYLGYR